MQAVAASSDVLVISNVALEAELDSEELRCFKNLHFNNCGHSSFIIEIFIYKGIRGICVVTVSSMDPFKSL